MTPFWPLHWTLGLGACKGLLVNTGQNTHRRAMSVGRIAALLLCCYKFLELCSFLYVRYSSKRDKPGPGLGDVRGCMTYDLPPEDKKNSRDLLGCVGCEGMWRGKNEKMGQIPPDPCFLFCSVDWYRISTHSIMVDVIPISRRAAGGAPLKLGLRRLELVSISLSNSHSHKTLQQEMRCFLHSMYWQLQS